MTRRMGDLTNATHIQLIETHPESLPVERRPLPLSGEKGEDGPDVVQVQGPRSAAVGYPRAKSEGSRAMCVQLVPSRWAILHRNHQRNATFLCQVETLHIVGHLGL